ncbi:MAG: ribbon-helix-helix domain-containing protein [Candidatus Thermoplasmatota archaeon]|nr:ribbon-helix-helix domain-containing protein [Candidatus Thermoplasmatota archaeon]
MVQCRIPEDHLMALDQMVGLDGMRNRSDVIRLAVRQLIEASPSRAVGGTISVDLGMDLTDKIEMFCGIHGDTPDQVTRAALRAHMKAEMLASDDLQTVLETRHQQLANRLRQREDHTP